MLVTDQPTAVPATENQAEDIAAARGVRYRIVLERDVLEQTSQSELVAVMRRNEEVRVSDRVPTKLVIADRRTAMVPLEADSPDPAALVIHSTGLVRSLAVALRLRVARGVAAAVRLARWRRDRPGAARA